MLTEKTRYGAYVTLQPTRNFKQRHPLSNNLDQHLFPSPSVELAVQDLFPRPEIQTAFRDGDDDFTAHNLPLQVRVGVVPSILLRTGLAGSVVLLLTGGCAGRQFLQPIRAIGVETTFVIAD